MIMIDDDENACNVLGGWFGGQISSYKVWLVGKEVQGSDEEGRLPNIANYCC